MVVSCWLLVISPDKQTTNNKQQTTNNKQQTTNNQQPMTRDSEEAVAYAVILLSHYGFDLRGYTAQELVNRWLEKYQPNWIGLAVIEALYQGRYKAVSVEQILRVWTRRGQPIYRFNHEFERLICRKLPQNLSVSVRANSTDLNEEATLRLLTDTSEEILEQQLMIEVTDSEELLPTNKADNPFLKTTAIQEERETSFNSDQPVQDAVTYANSRPLSPINSSRTEVNKNPIQQFTPPPDYSGFYLKLKKVVEEGETLQSF
ncbi:MAG TPA: hypothetical protein DEG47_09235 [Cyanobacteria bacterium UBA11148]|nr:hypothetical protein [Cyanobacteria bacterium UBA11148]